jgi:hypothetical protein
LLAQIVAHQFLQARNYKVQGKIALRKSSELHDLPPGFGWSVPRHCLSRGDFLPLRLRASKNDARASNSLASVDVSTGAYRSDS